MSRAVFPVMAVALLTTPLLADEPKTKADTPEAVARRAMDSLKEDRLDDFAKAMHPEALKSIKTALVSVAEAAAKDGKRKEISRSSATRAWTTLKKLDDAQFFVAFYSGITTLRPELKRSVRGRGGPDHRPCPGRKDTRTSSTG